jgi:hypothetical protein
MKCKNHVIKSNQSVIDTKTGTSRARWSRYENGIQIWLVEIDTKTGTNVTKTNESKMKIIK